MSYIDTLRASIADLVDYLKAQIKKEARCVIVRTDTVMEPYVHYLVAANCRMVIPNIYPVDGMYFSIQKLSSFTPTVESTSYKIVTPNGEDLIVSFDVDGPIHCVWDATVGKWVI